MIVDSAKVSMFDGTFLPAMEVYPGKQVLSFSPTRQIKRVIVRDKSVESQTNAICLLLSNGQKLTGSRDQHVATYREKHVRFIPLADVQMGDRLRGEKAGVPTIVTVIGLSFDLNREVRLVALELGGKNFVAEGVVCR